MVAKKPIEDICIPEMSTWPELIKANQQKSISYSSNLRNIRSEVLALAREYTSFLDLKSKQIFGVSICDTSLSDNVSQVVANGHQPEIIHSGIMYKYELLDKYCRLNQALGLNIIIDTDEGNSGTFILPAFSAGVPSKRKLELDSINEPFLFKTLPDKLFLRETLDEFRKLSRTERLQQNAYNIEYAADAYLALAGETVADAHTMVRRLYQKSPAYLEVKLSAVLKLASVKRFFADIIEDGDRFSSTYNAQLDIYRDEQKIKNPANPFPNLKCSGARIELPFWIIDPSNKKRMPVYVDTTREPAQIIFEEGRLDVNQAFEDFIIVPKAALITAFIRMALCDLFIHGLGGAKYDRVTDLLLKNYFHIDAPAYVTASSNNYFYAEEIAKYESEKEKAEERRRMRFHIDKYLSHFDEKPEVKESLRLLVAAKNENIEKIKEGKKTKSSTAHETHEIKRIEKEISSILDEFFGPETVFEEPSKTYLDTIYSRDFTYLIYALREDKSKIA